MTVMTESAEQRLAAVRAAFPALGSETIFLDNAGGSLVPRCVADAVHSFFLTDYVQLEAPYAESERATEMVSETHDFINLFMNGVGVGSVALGPSTTRMIMMLADCYSQTLAPGDEIILCQAAHEANAGPWLRLGERGVQIKWWPFDPDWRQCSITGLRNLLTDRTRIVAFSHVSNLLGDITDVEAITACAHEAGARVVVDGVAYAPHRAIDVASWNVDWYVYSTYKVYGPHMAALFGRHECFAELTGPNHAFIAADDIPYKFEPGGAAYEGCAALLGLRPHLNQLAGNDADDETTRSVIEQAFRAMTELELPVQSRLIEYLAGHPRVRIIGPSVADSSRVATICFRHDSKRSADISAALGARGVGNRFGHMYAPRLTEALGLDEDGVVRLSAVHYNSVEEADRVISALEEIL